MPNIYTTPLTGNIAYRHVGIIKAVGPYGEKVSVGKIEYQHFDDESFQYIISPFWDIIDGLPPRVFQGIPGINMEKRFENYYRANYVPVFITERSPSPNREDLWELMKSVGLDYYDRMEWLIRTPMRAANDNLIVERMRDDKEVFDFRHSKEGINRLQYGDEVIVDSIADFGSTPGSLSKTLAMVLFAGADIRIESTKKTISKKERPILIPFVLAEYYAAIHEQKNVQKSGISAAKKAGKYKGRAKTEIDKTLFEDALKRFKTKQITIKEAMSLSGISSRSTFYRRIKDV
ncbi:MAG: recombinase family protein [Saccharofermentanales bacterium]